MAAFLSFLPRFYPWAVTGKISKSLRQPVDCNNGVFCRWSYLVDWPTWGTPATWTPQCSACAPFQSSRLPSGGGFPSSPCSVRRPKSRLVPLESFFLFRYSGALRSTGPNAPSDYITAALRDLYETMDKTSSSLPPIILLQFLHIAFPQFAEKGDQGQYLQQVTTLGWIQHLTKDS